MNSRTKRMFRERSREDDRIAGMNKKAFKKQMRDVADVASQAAMASIEDTLSAFMNGMSSLAAQMAEQQLRERERMKREPLYRLIMAIESARRAPRLTRYIHIPAEMFYDPDSEDGRKLRAHIDGMNLGRWDAVLRGPMGEYYREEVDIWSRKEYPHCLTILCGNLYGTEDLMQALM